jgi:hypothetical protein
MVKFLVGIIVGVGATILFFSWSMERPYYHPPLTRVEKRIVPIQIQYYHQPYSPYGYGGGFSEEQLGVDRGLPYLQSDQNGFAYGRTPSHRTIRSRWGYAGYYNHPNWRGDSTRERGVDRGLPHLELNGSGLRYYRAPSRPY